MRVEEVIAAYEAMGSPADISMETVEAFMMGRLPSIRSTMAPLWQQKLLAAETPETIRAKILPTSHDLSVAGEGHAMSIRQLCALTQLGRDLLALEVTPPSDDDQADPDRREKSRIVELAESTALGRQLMHGSGSR